VFCLCIVCVVKGFTSTIQNAIIVEILTKEETLILVLGHPKGGVGKSTTACNLAVELDKRFDNFKALDLDDQYSLSVFNGRRGKAGLKQFDLIKSVNTEEYMDLPADEKAKVTENFKRVIKENTGVLLIDTGGWSGGLNKLAWLSADLVITPMKVSEDIEVYGVARFKKILLELRKYRPDLKAKVLIAREEWNSKQPEVFKRRVKNDEVLEVFDTVIRKRAVYSQSFKKGKSVLELNVHEAKVEINKLIEEIINE
jgi:chromosome partitioning protein